MIAEAMSAVWPSYGAWADELDVPESVPVEDAEPLEPAPSSASRDTIPAPAPDDCEASPPTSRSPRSSPVTDRVVVIEII